MATPITLKYIVEEAAKKLQCFVSATNTVLSVSPHITITLPKIADLAFDAERFESWYAWRSQNEWRLIDLTGLPALTTVTVTRGFDTAVAAGEVIGLYNILDPDSWRDAARSALKDKFRRVRLPVPLVTAQKEYPLTALAPWLTSEGQVYRVFFRRGGSSVAAPQETEAPAVRVVEEDFGVTLRFETIPSDITDTAAIVEARRYFEPPAEDDDTITLPEGLAIAATKWEALKLIFQKLGPNAKRNYGQAMVLAENELAEQEARWLDREAKRDLHQEEAPLFSDPFVGDWGW